MAKPIKVDKATEEDKAYFTALFGDHPALHIKPMFGNLAAFVTENQQMCAGLFGSSIGLRLAEDERAALLAIPGAGPFGPEGRPMKQYIAIPPSWRDGREHDEGDTVDAWIDLAVSHTESLPMKKQKPPKKKPAKMNSKNG